MGLHIMVGREAGGDSADDMAVFYDSTVGVAFGPTMGSDDEAQAFIKWLGETDPRNLVHKELMEAHARFVMEMVCECGTVRELECEWCNEGSPVVTIPAHSAHELAEAPHTSATRVTLEYLRFRGVLVQREHRWPCCIHCGQVEADHLAHGRCPYVEEGCGNVRVVRYGPNVPVTTTTFEAGEQCQVEKCMADPAPEPGERFECDYCRRRHAEEAAHKAQRALARSKAADRA